MTPFNPSVIPMSPNVTRSDPGVTPADLPSGSRTQLPTEGLSGGVARVAAVAGSVLPAADGVLCCCSGASAGTRRQRGGTAQLLGMTPSQPA